MAKGTKVLSIVRIVLIMLLMLSVIKGCSDVCSSSMELIDTTNAAIVQ